MFFKDDGKPAAAARQRFVFSYDGRGEARVGRAATAHSRKQSRDASDRWAGAARGLGVEHGPNQEKRRTPARPRCFRHRLCSAKHWQHQYQPIDVQNYDPPPMDGDIFSESRSTVYELGVFTGTVRKCSWSVQKYEWPKLNCFATQFCVAPHDLFEVGAAPPYGGSARKCLAQWKTNCARSVQARLLCCFSATLTLRSVPTWLLLELVRRIAVCPIVDDTNRNTGAHVFSNFL